MIVSKEEGVGTVPEGPASYLNPTSPSLSTQNFFNTPSYIKNHYYHTSQQRQYPLYQIVIMKVSTILASALFLATGEAYRISLYSSPSYQGTQRSYSTNGVHTPGFTVRSWIWDSNLGDGCCVVFCRGSTVSYQTPMLKKRLAAN
jgi:hypothetical protein